MRANTARTNKGARMQRICRARSSSMPSSRSACGSAPALFAVSGHFWRRQVRQLGFVHRIHAWAEAMLGQCFREHLAHHRRLVSVVDLVAAEPSADPRQWHALAVARRRMLEREIARRHWPGIEMLMEPGVRRHDQGAVLPVIALGLLAFL